MNKKVLITLTLAATTLVTAGCSTMAQEFSLASDLKALKADPAAAKYSKVTARAQAAYNKSDYRMATNLINIVKKKVATGSTY